MGHRVLFARRVDALRSPRRGFTLVELLVSMTIILILAGMTMAALSISANGDRVPGAARQTQSMILGARDRAIYAGEPRGVRLVTDPDGDPARPVVSSLVFIGAPQAYSRGFVDVEFIDDGNPATNDWFVTEIKTGNVATDTGWSRLAMRRLLLPWARIRIPPDNSRWYSISEFVDVHGDGRISGRLTRPYEGQPVGQMIYQGLTYEVTLTPAVLPGEQPRLLPRGVVIDLQSSILANRLPSSWYVSGSTTPELDIMFNERGTVDGPLASLGVLSLVIADFADVATGFNVNHRNSGDFDVNGDGANDQREGDERILSVFTSSGTINVAPVNETPDSSDLTLRADPWSFAETGLEG